MPASLPPITTTTTTRTNEVNTDTPASGVATTKSSSKNVETTTTTNVSSSKDQFTPAVWSLSDNFRATTIVFLDITGEFAQGRYLTIHRVTNEWDQDIIVETEYNQVRLGPLRSIDVSSAQVTLSVPDSAVIDPAKPPGGTYTLLCCALLMAQASPARLTGSAPPALKAPGGGGAGGPGGPGGGGAPPGGGGGNPPPGPPQPKPDADSPLNRLKELLKEAERIREKLKIARRFGQETAAKRLEDLLRLVEKRIGLAAVAEADAEIEQLGRDAQAMGGGD